MNQYFVLLPIILYSLIAFQDFRERAISWILIPLLITINLAGNIWLHGFSAPFLLKIFMLNLVVTGCQFILLQVYICIRYKKFTLITEHFVGAGDLAFYLVLFVTFSPLNLFFFHLASLLICLLTGILLLVTRKKNGVKTIPMAGIQAVFLILLTVTSVFNPSVTFFNEEWLLKIMAYVC